MTQETAQRVSELYKEKSKTLIELSIMLEWDLIICSDRKAHYYEPLSTLSEEFREKIRKQTIEYLQQRLKEIDNELEKL